MARIVLAALGALVALVGSPLAHGQDKPAGPSHSAAELFADLESSDPQRSRAAFDMLVRFGPEILPEVEKRLAACNARPLADLYLAIRYPSELVVTQPNTPVDLTKSDDELAKITPVVSTKDMTVWEKALYSKYLEAVRLVKLANFDQALRICEAIVTLDSAISFRNQVKQLKVYADERLLMRNIVRCQVKTDRNLYEIGEVIDVSLTLENLTTELLELDFTPSGDIKDPAMLKYFESFKPAAIFEIMYSQYDPMGTVVSNQRTNLIEIDKQIRLGPGEKWVRTFSIDTMRDNPTNQLYRCYRIQGQLRPIQIRHGGQGLFRRIPIDPLVVRVFPPDVDPPLQDPIGFLTRALQGGVPNDIFLCALLVPKEKQDDALKLLMDALGKANPTTQQAIMATLRQITEEPIPFEVEEWNRWWCDHGYSKLEQGKKDDGE